jgi:hypothetical protein
MELTKILSSGIDANSVTPAILTKIGSSFDADSSTLTVPNLSVTTVSAGNLKTNNLLYANGTAYSFGSSNAAGSNTQVQFNNANSFAASGNLTFDTTTNTLTSTNFAGNGSGLSAITGANVSGQVGNALVAGTVYTNAQPNITSVGTLSNLAVTGNVTAGNISTSGSGGNITGANNISANTFTGNGSLLTSITGGNVTGQVGNALVASSVYTNAQPNITSVGTLTSLSVTGDISGANLVLTGNLTVSGTTTTVNSSVARIVDPIVEQGGGANGAALTNNDSKDRGALLHYYTGSSATDAFMGWDNSNAEFAFGSNVSVTSEVVTFNSLGNVRANFFLGNGSQLTGISTSSFANGNSNLSIPSANGNVNISAVGNANVIVITGTGANINGYANISGTLTAGNISTSGSGGNITGANVISANTFTASGNITAINANLGNAVIANYFIGNFYGTANLATFASTANSVAGANVSGAVSFASTANAVAGANVSGAVSFASTANSVAGANVSGQVGNALVAGTVYTNAQPNITSVGTLTSLGVTGNITGGNANLGNSVVANFFTGSGAFLTSVTAVTAATVTTNAQPNITSVGTLTALTVGNATANSTFGNGTITSTGNISFTGANVSLGAVGNLKITGGTAGYFLSTDGAGNLSWGAAEGGGGVSATGSNTQIQFNDAGSLGASANLTFDKATNVFTTARVVASNGANLGSNIANVYIGGGSNNQILKTDGSGNLSWIAQPVAVITVDNFTGDGTTTAFTLTATPTSINQTIVNYNGALQLRAAYTVGGTTLTFSEAPVNGALIEVTTTIGATSGAGAFVTRAYTGNGVATTFAVTSGVTVSSVIVTENGLVQVPTTDYTISGSTLTFAVAPANGIIINIRELAIAVAPNPITAITVQDEGSNLTTTASLLNFVGAGVTASNSGSNVTVTIPSGSNNARTTGYALVFGG